MKSDRSPEKEHVPLGLVGLVWELVLLVLVLELLVLVLELLVPEVEVELLVVVPSVVPPKPQEASTTYSATPAAIHGNRSLLRMHTTTSSAHILLP